MPASCTAVTCTNVGGAVVGRDETVAFFGVDNRLPSRAVAMHPQTSAARCIGSGAGRAIPDSAALLTGR
jgi:hypothetical protein